jgi:hypothetical protein
VSENRVLRRIFGPKRDQVTGGWRKLYNEEFPNLYASQNIINVIKSRKIKCVGTCSTQGRDKKFTQSSVGEPEKRRPLGRPRSRGGDNIKIDVAEIGWEGVD